MTATSYDYRAVDRTGVMRKGITSGTTQVEAYRRLVSLGLTPVVLRPAAQRGSYFDKSNRRIPLRELAHLTYSLGVLVSARIPISEGLLTIAQQEKDQRTRDLILDLAKRIESGEQVAIAMDVHRRKLGETYVETIRAAEKAGNLPKVFEMLSEMLERTQENNRMVRSAMMYPACVVTVLFFAMAFLITFVVPKFAKMFQGRGAKLPFFTDLLMQVGLSVQNYWWVYLGVIAVAGFFVRKALKGEHGRHTLDRLMHKVPYIRGILVGAAISRFCRIFSVSLSSGLGLIESLELSGKASGRPLLLNDVRTLAKSIRAGGQLTTGIDSCKYLTPFSKRMLVAGEQSAEIPRMCGVVARHYDRETAHLTKNIGTVIEPVLIVGIAGMVLVVALAVFLPMWDMIKIVG